jgi:hypothetical protein
VTVPAQLASPHAGILYLVEMNFTTGVYRFTNWTHTVSWGGHEWLGYGSILGINQVSESESLQWPALDITLNIANQAQLALALGNVATYRNRDINLYFAVLDDELRAVGDPQLCWAGHMDQVRLKTGDGEREAGVVSMRCEIPGKDGRGPQSLRLNNAQQQARYPGDTGLSRIEALNGKPVTWLSTRFQRQ